MAKDPEPLDVFWHPAVLKHDIGKAAFETPPSPLLAVAERHVEGPDRVRNMRAILKRGPIARHLCWRRGRYASLDELGLFHDADYLRALEGAARSGGKWYTRTTCFTASSWLPALAAAGTALAAMAHILSGRGKVAYALVRPPGHHAAPGMADGYCFINNAALAAQLAIERGVARVAVIDWDVHHGNGTQEGFYERDDVLTVSLHMDHGPWGPTHPQTGHADEVGRGRGKGFNFNVPLPMGTGDRGYALALSQVVRPALESFRPEMIVVANGQDGSQFDPNGRQLLSMAGFRALGRFAREMADAHTGGRLLLVQEGGYQVSYAAFCLHASLEGVLGLGPLLDDPIAFYPEDTRTAEQAIDRILAERARALAAS